MQTENIPENHQEQDIAAQILAKGVVDAFQGAFSTVASVTNGVKSVVRCTAKSSLHIAAESADLVSKFILITAPIVSGVLLADAFAEKPLFFQDAKCGMPLPIIALDRVEGFFCSGDYKNLLSKGIVFQKMAGFGMLLVGTPVGGLAFRKISQLCRRGAEAL